MCVMRVFSSESSSAYSRQDDRRFRTNVTGDSAGSALLWFFTLGSSSFVEGIDCYILMYILVDTLEAIYE